jgi:hypothetical protein
MVKPAGYEHTTNDYNQVSKKRAGKQPLYFIVVLLVLRDRVPDRDR